MEVAWLQGWGLLCYAQSLTALRGPGQNVTPYTHGGLPGNMGGSAKAWPRGLPHEVFMEVFMEDPCGQVLPRCLDYR